MDNLDKQLADLQAGLDAQLQQVQADIDGALGGVNSNENESCPEGPKKMKKYYAEIHLTKGYQLVYTPVVDRKDAEFLVETIDGDAFIEKCDEMLMGDEGVNAQFFHMMPKERWNDEPNSRLIIKDEDGHIVYEKDRIYRSIPHCSPYSYYKGHYCFADNIDTDYCNLQLYGCADEGEFFDWANEKREKLQASFDYDELERRIAEVRKYRFNILGVYEETDTTIKFSEFETDSFDPTKLTFYESGTPIWFFESTLIGNQLAVDIEVDSLAYDDHVIGVDEHDYSYIRKRSIELLKGDDSYTFMDDL